MRTVMIGLILCGLSMGCQPDEMTDNTWFEDDAVTPMTLAATTQPAEEDPFPNCPQAEQIMPRGDWEQARGTYRAQQSGKTVMIHASGEHPRAGYETKLAMNLTRIYPPQFTLLAKPPEGPSATVMTPFETCVKFTVGDPIKSVIVFDATGRHEVTVEQK